MPPLIIGVVCDRLEQETGLVQAAHESYLQAVAH